MTKLWICWLGSSEVLDNIYTWLSYIRLQTVHTDIQSSASRKIRWRIIIISEFISEFKTLKDRRILVLLIYNVISIDSERETLSPLH